MAKTLQSKYKKLVEELSPLSEMAKGLKYRVIIAMKGHPCTGRRLVAFSLAATMKCLLLKEDDIVDNGSKQSPPLPSAEASEETNQPLDQILCRFVESQLPFDRSVIIDSKLSNHSQFTRLQNLANSTRMVLVVVECKPSNAIELWQSLDQKEGDVDIVTHWWDKPSSLEDLQRLLHPQSNYDIGSVPKFMVDIKPAGDIKECISDVLQSIDSYVNPPVKCTWHRLLFEDKDDDKKTRCTECHQCMSGPIYRCRNCHLTFHRSCTKLPQQFVIENNTFTMTLQCADDHGDEIRCNCCKQLIKGNYYDDYGVKHVQLDLNCMFLPYKCTTTFHEHQLSLACLREDNYRCDACGVITDQKLHYTCHQCRSERRFIRIDPYCVWLPETVHTNHRHPFKLTRFSQGDSSEYYCDFCEEIRNPNYWIYYCAENCDYAGHVRCLVSPTLPFLQLDNI